MIPRHPAGYQMLAKGASNRLPRAGLIFHETLWTAQPFTWVIVLLKRCNYWQIKQAQSCACTLEETGTAHPSLLFMVWTWLGVPYSPSGELPALVSPGIALDDGDELRSCSEAQQDAVLGDGGSQGLPQGTTLVAREGALPGEERSQPARTYHAWIGETRESNLEGVQES